MARFSDTPVRKAIDKKGLTEIYERQFSTFTDGLSKDDIAYRIKRFGKCECGCKAPLAGRCEWEHTTPLGLQIQEPGKPAPKIKWKAYLPACHKPKTKKDKGDIARAKRRAGLTGQKARRERRERPLIQSRNEWPQGRKMQSRGFRMAYTPNVKVID